MYTPGVGQELSVDQPRDKLLNKEIKQLFQAITRRVMYLPQVTRYVIESVVNQLTRKMTKSAKAHTAATGHSLWYLAGIPKLQRICYSKCHVRSRTVTSSCRFRSTPAVAIELLLPRSLRPASDVVMELEVVKLVTSFSGSLSSARSRETCRQNIL